MIVSKSSALVGAAMLLGVYSSANAVVLTFDGNICNGGSSCVNGSPIDQSYGDIAGQLDVIYDREVSDTVPVSSLLFWGPDYSDLTNVAYGTTTPEIFLSPLTGYEVTLNSFDLGAWPNTDRSSQWTLLDGLGNLLLSSGPITVGGTTATSVAPGLTSANGIRIQFGPDAFNVGIDNIDFTVRETDEEPGVAVPEPTSMALLGLGLGLLGFRARRRFR
jgi:hypothetical protein